jgi:hypothetical protein
LTTLTNLKELVATFCPNVTSKGVKKLKQAIPGLEVEE